MDAPGGARWGEHLGVTAVYALLAILATWPLVLHIEDSLNFGEDRFDGYGTIWFGEHVFRVVQGQAELLTTQEVGWPEGLSLRLADSFLFGLLYLPFRALFAPAAAFNLFTLAALASTAWSGFWLGRSALGLSRPAAFAVGLVVGFNALQHTYRVEGEAYLLAGFLLPLFAGQLWKGAQSGRFRDAVGAGLLLGLLAWSSGYFAIDGAVVGASLGVALLLASPHPRLPIVGGFAVGAAALILPLAAVVVPVLTETIGARVDAAELGSADPVLDLLRNISYDSANLAGWWFPDPDTVHLRQQRLFYLGWPALTASVVVLARQGWRRTLPWALLAATGALLSLGPYLRLDDTMSDQGPPLPYYALVRLHSAWLAYRMPLRFLSITFVGMGVLVGFFVEALWARRERRAAVAFLGMLTLDGLFFTGLATDRTEAQGKVPSAYAALSGEGAVLDVFAPQSSNLRNAGLSVYYQAHHGAPTLANFTLWQDARAVLAERLALALVDGDEAQLRKVFSVLAGLGVTEVALHPGDFLPDDAAALDQALRSRCTLLQGPSVDDPDAMSLFALPRQGALSRQAALQALAAWSPESTP